MALSDVLCAIQNKLSFSKSVEISGVKFKLGLLTYDEEIKTNSLPESDENPMVYFSAIRMQTLSYAIKEINGEKIPAVVEIKNGDEVEKKQGSIVVKEFLSTLPDKMIEQLFDIYVDLKDQVDNILSKDIKYDWFKTPEQREKERKEREDAEYKKKVNAEIKEETNTDEEIKFRKIEEPDTGPTA